MHEKFGRNQAQAGPRREPLRDRLRGGELPGPPGRRRSSSASTPTPTCTSPGPWTISTCSPATGRWRRPSPTPSPSSCWWPFRRTGSSSRSRPGSWRSVLLGLKKVVSLVELDSPYGHDAFLLEVANLSQVIHGFLEKPALRRNGVRRRRAVARPPCRGHGPDAARSAAAQGPPRQRHRAGPRSPASSHGLDAISSLIEPGSHVLDIGCGDGSLIDTPVAQPRGHRHRHRHRPGSRGGMPAQERAGAAKRRRQGPFPDRGRGSSTMPCSTAPCRR